MSDPKSKIPDREHVSEAVRRANPHLWPEQAAKLPPSASPAPAPALASPPAAADSQSEPGEAQKPRRAKEPNRTEREYEAMLKRQYPNAAIRWEAYTLRLASRATYCPDFAVIHLDGRVDFHEVKGSYVFPKALVKPRIAAAQFPQHPFFLAQKRKTGWEIEQLPNR